MNIVLAFLRSLILNPDTARRVVAWMRKAWDGLSDETKGKILDIIKAFRNAKGPKQRSAAVVDIARRLVLEARTEEKAKAEALLERAQRLEAALEAARKLPPTQRVRRTIQLRRQRSQLLIEMIAMLVEKDSTAIPPLDVPDEADLAPDAEDPPSEPAQG